MKEPVKFGVILLLFCAISAGLLAVVNGFTAPIIAEAELQSTLQSYRDIFKDGADDFEIYDSEKLENVKNDYPQIESIFIAKKAGEKVGYCVNVSSNGFGGQMVNAICIRLDGDIIAGFRNISHQETKGFGSHITDEEYFSSYVDKSAKAPLKIAKEPANEDEVLWISGATVSSKAVLEGSNVVVDVYNNVLKNDK